MPKNNSPERKALRKKGADYRAEAADPNSHYRQHLNEMRARVKALRELADEYVEERDA